MVEVSDSGPGIPASAVRRATMGDAALPDATDAGMGLAISVQLALRAGARLDFGRAKHGGARVRLVLTRLALPPVSATRNIATAT